MTETSELTACRTVLIPDRIAADDAFRHKEIARAIAGTILENEGGCAIALTGSWGSGKSTVVKFLEDQLKTAEVPVQTFIFDAWAHQGDPLRRTFLEKLIGWCNTASGKWTNRTRYWQGVVEEISRRKELVETKSSPRLTGWGVVGVLSLLVAPIALQVYQKIHHEWHPHWEAFALLMSGLPLFVAFTLWAWWRIKESGKREDEKEPIPNLIFTSADNLMVSKTSKTPDPTSVEFEKIYQELLTEVLTGDEARNKRRLLLVIDNLDRVRHEDARAIWATLRVFFDPATKGKSDWRNRVWVLVPFDPEAIDDLWESNEVRSIEITGQPNEKNGRVAASRHFLEKTFQATFRVPPIILTNWEDYLISQLRRAFPNPKHNEQEFHAIFRLYHRLKAVTKDEWLVALRGETALLDSALALKSHGLELDLAFEDALFADATEKLSQVRGAKPRLNWRDLVELLTESESNAFRLRLSNLFSGDIGRIGGLLGNYGEFLAQLVLETGPEKFYERIKQIIETPDEAEVDWLTSVVKEWRPQSKAMKDTRKNWSKRVEEVMQKDLPGNLRSALHNLKEVLDGHIEL